MHQTFPLDISRPAVVQSVVVYVAVGHLGVFCASFGHWVGLSVPPPVTWVVCAAVGRVVDSIPKQSQVPPSGTQR